MHFYRQTGVVVGQAGVNAEVKRMADEIVESILSHHAGLGDDWPDGICVEVMVYERGSVEETVR